MTFIRDEKAAGSAPSGAFPEDSTPAAEPTHNFPASFNHSQPPWKCGSSPCRGGSETSQEEMLTLFHQPCIHATSTLYCFHKSDKNRIFLPSSCSCFLLTQEVVSEVGKRPLLPRSYPALPPVPEESFSVWSQCRPFSLLALRQRGGGWPKWDKGTGQACELLPQDPPFNPPLLEVKRGLFERQKKATKSLLEQCFNCYQIPLIVVGQEPGDTRMECSICSHTFPHPKVYPFARRKEKHPKVLLFTTLPGPQSPNPRQIG